METMDKLLGKADFSIIQIFPMNLHNANRNTMRVNMIQNIKGMFYGIIVLINSTITNYIYIYTYIY